MPEVRRSSNESSLIGSSILDQRAESNESSGPIADVSIIFISDIMKLEGAVGNIPRTEDIV